MLSKLLKDGWRKFTLFLLFTYLLIFGFLEKLFFLELLLPTTLKETFSSTFRILQDSMSSTYEGEGPKPWFRVEMAIFYIVFFVVFPFFFVNIFVALIIVTFNELGEAELQDDMDKNQKSCM